MITKSYRFFNILTQRKNRITLYAIILPVHLNQNETHDETGSQRPEGKSRQHRETEFQKLIWDNTSNIFLTMNH